MFESLEHRRLLDATLDGSGNLTVNGSSAADTITISLDGPNTRVIIQPENFNQTFPTASITLIGVVAGDGADTVTIVDAVVAPAVVQGDAGNDTITAGGGNDTIQAGDGNDSLAGGPGADAIAGDGGDDTVTYVGATAAVSVYVDGVANDGTAGEGDNVDTSVDNIFGSNFDDRLSAAIEVGPKVIYGLGGNDTLVGGLSVDHLNGGPGNDDLRGGSGSDTMVGGAGRDIFNGGGGNDLVTYYYAASAVSLAANARSLSGTAREQDNIKADVERLTGTNFGDTIVGNASINVIRGLNGNDTITGGAGADNLFGDAGNDSLLALDGETDNVDGGTGTDTADADPEDVLTSIP
jgi:Ca2+-binding RTX toxin-like protein